jgi:YD repeat-containing protein
LRKRSTKLAAAFLGFALAAALAAAPPDRAQTAAGTISKIQASERTITVTLADGSEARFVWNADTKIGGVLAPGAKVTIRYETAPDGRNLAQQISVARS